jgi:hypothetical protein
MTRWQGSRPRSTAGVASPHSRLSPVRRVSWFGMRTRSAVSRVPSAEDDPPTLPADDGPKTESFCAERYAAADRIASPGRNVASSRNVNSRPAETVALNAALSSPGDRCDQTPLGGRSGRLRGSLPRWQANWLLVDPLPCKFEEPPHDSRTVAVPRKRRELVLGVGRAAFDQVAGSTMSTACGTRLDLRPAPAGLRQLPSCPGWLIDDARTRTAALDQSASGIPVSVRRPRPVLHAPR